ncbi:MAG: hypothetical protein NWE77_00405 [Candidatus Bathyarchaeota archaeon]|jgi:hypothetical protein|nr:hypothetical protein [Candidatus Bathyarchaeota archaeon]
MSVDNGDLIPIEKMPQISRRGKTNRLFERLKTIKRGFVLRVKPEDYGLSASGVRYGLSKWNKGKNESKHLTSSIRRKGGFVYIMFKADKKERMRNGHDSKHDK